MHLIVGIAAPALPQGKAAIQLFQNGLVQPFGILLGEDQHLDGDVLLVHPIQKQCLKHHVNGGIDGGGQVEQHGAQRVQRCVEGDGEPAHRETLPLFAEVQAQHVQSAGGAAAGEDNAAGKAADDAAHQTGGQLVRDDRRGGRRDHRQRDGVNDGHGGHAHHKVPAQRAPRQHDQRQIHQQVEDTRQIHRGLQPQRRHQQGTDHLTQTVQAAAVHALRHDDQVDARRHQDAAQHTHAQPQPFVLLHLLQHTLTLLIYK